MKLSLLIPSTPDRNAMLLGLIQSIRKQIGELDLWGQVEILTDITPTWKDEPTKTNKIGFKRNKLKDLADGEYMAFIDSDDRVVDNYLKLLFEGIDKGVDCCSLTGIITEDGENPLKFQHSIRYKEWKTNPEGNPIRYERSVNHLNTIRSSIAKQFMFPEKNHGEDRDWSEQIHKSGLLKTEFWIEDVLYFYDHVSKK